MQLSYQETWEIVDALVEAAKLCERLHLEHPDNEEIAVAYAWCAGMARDRLPNFGAALLLDEHERITGWRWLLDE